MAKTTNENPNETADQSGTKNPQADPAAASNDAAAGTDPIALITADHRQVEQLFGAFEKATNAGQRSHLAEEICKALVVHALIEEEIFYPACQDRMEQRLLNEAQVEHDGAKALIREVQSGSPEDQYFDAKVKVLSEEIKHHVREEEKPTDGILAKAKAAGIATPELGRRLAARKQQLMQAAEAGTLGPPETRSFRARTNAGMRSVSKENEMARSSTMERDSRGRFVGDDDDRDDRRSPSRSRYDDDRRPMPPRDEEGRFMSRDDDDDYRRSSRSHYDDDDGYRRSSSARYDDDDRRRSMPARDDEGRFTSSRSRSYDDDRRGDRGNGDRGHGGWFGDSRGHSEAARRGWDNPDHRPSGWYGDSEGHSEAARRGWDERGETRTHSRYEDDDRRGERGHGGWYGDPRGHSEASRRGWEERGEARSGSRYEEDDRRGGHGGWYGDPEGHSRAARRGRN